MFQINSRNNEAIDDFTTAISLAPRAAAPWNGRGASYLAIGNVKSALVDFNEALRRDRNSHTAWTNRGFAEEQLGDKRAAKISFQRALRVKPKHKPALDGLARINSKPKDA